MNETNHKRVIEKFAEKAGIGKTEIAILKAASNYTDSINSEWKYFYYHFYYDIDITGNYISLKRVDENTNSSSDSINHCGNQSYFSHPTDELTYYLLSKFNEKEFFSTLIHERPRSPRHDMWDVGNQSDNVAFLHAMGAAGEDEKTSRTNFENHLKKCFAEYLFIEQPNTALFILGIALHGIMDSFTPSHMGFQKYTEQDWGLHAQGDVVPFEGDVVKFDPGQISKAGLGESFLARTKKGYNSSDHINDKEFKMFKIFSEIAGLTSNSTIKSILDGTMDLSSTKVVRDDCGSHEEIEPRSLGRLNTILEENKVVYDKKSFIFSNAAIDVCKQVFEYLSEQKKEIYSDYEKYKKGKETIIQKALNLWSNKYDSEDIKDTIKEQLQLMNSVTFQEEPL